MQPRLDRCGRLLLATRRQSVLAQVLLLFRLMLGELQVRLSNHRILGAHVTPRPWGGRNGARSVVEGLGRSFLAGIGGGGRKRLRRFRVHGGRGPPGWRPCGGCDLLHLEALLELRGRLGLGTPSRLRLLVLVGLLPALPLALALQLDLTVALLPTLLCLRGARLPLAGRRLVRPFALLVATFVIQDIRDHRLNVRRVAVAFNDEVHYVRLAVTIRLQDFGEFRRKSRRRR
mmetsp:Transcript_16080/g.44120  ORF Transcript_16080/g.44120 Transcript_16080/m.44120 type:complete len:231 (+) Transcript_16080:885-1577(+)